MLILENADLDGAPAGAYELVCLPAKLVGSDGAFARAILIRRDALARLDAPGQPDLPDRRAA